MDSESQEQNQTSEFPKNARYFYVCTSGLENGKTYFRDGLICTESLISVITNECFVERRVLINMIELTKEEYTQLVENMEYINEKYKQFLHLYTQEAEQTEGLPDETTSYENDKEEDKNKKRYPDISGYS